MLDILFRKKNIVAILLVAIIFFHFLNNFIWLKKDSFLCGPDAKWHLIQAIKFQLLFRKALYVHSSFFVKSAKIFNIFRTYNATPNWPPLIYFLSALINPKHIYLFCLRMYINFIFYIILILSIYFLGKKCFNQRVGLIASFLISFYPAIYALSRQFGLDFPLTCLTALCVCLLVYSEDFSKRNYSLLFGLSLGFASLVKLQIMFFVVAPLIYSIFKIFNKGNREKLKSFFNLIFSLAIAYILFYLYWGDKLRVMLIDFYRHTFSLYPFYKDGVIPVLGTELHIFSLRNFTFYLEGILYHVSLYLFLFFIFALIIFLIKKNKWKVFFLLSFLVPYIIFTFISVKWTRYALPLLGVMAIISAWLIDNLKLKYLKIIILGGLVFYCIKVYFLSSWIIKDYPRVKFLTPTMNDAIFPPAYPPDHHSFIKKLKKEETISQIESRLERISTITIRFGGDNTEDIAAFLYLFLQEYIFRNKVVIERQDDLCFNNADYIVMLQPDLILKNDLLKGYEISYKIDKFVFLVKK